MKKLCDDKKPERTMEIRALIRGSISQLNLERIRALFFNAVGISCKIGSNNRQSERIYYM